MSLGTSSLLPELKKQFCSYKEGCEEDSIAWSYLEGYFKGYICEKCIGEATKTHDKILEALIDEQRARHEQ